MNIKKTKNELRNFVKNILLTFEYNFIDPPKEPFIIHMCDGRYGHGGLTDRINGIISLYLFAKSNKRQFKAYFVHPFNLERYLPCNKYNYVIDDFMLTYNLRYALPKSLMNTDYEDFKEQLKSKKQLHVYCNSDYTEQMNGKIWRTLFHELFKPNDDIKKIVRNTKLKHKQWDSLVFRFQNSFGDFAEKGSEALDLDNQKRLIELCDSFIGNYILSNPNVNILICADSPSYKKHIIEKFPNKCFIYSYNNIHLDNNLESDYSIHLPAFVDFFLIANSENVISFYTKGMYPSSFPKYAAKVYDRPFKRIAI